MGVDIGRDFTVCVVSLYGVAAFVDIKCDMLQGCGGKVSDRIFQNQQHEPREFVFSAGLNPDVGAAIATITFMAALGHIEPARAATDPAGLDGARAIAVVLVRFVAAE